MEFRQARQFLAVVDNDGIVSAAKALGMAQPSVSQNIRSLERELGTPLFHRVGGGLVLTPAGEALVSAARQTLRDVALAEASVVDSSAPTQGSVIFSAVGATIDYLALSISALRAKAPDVHVKIHTPDNELDLRQVVYTGYSEFGLAPVESGETPPLPGRILRELEVDSLGYTLFMLVFPPGTQVPDPVPLDELPDFPVVAAPETAIGRRLVEKHLRNLHVRTRLGATVGHRDAQIPLVQCGVGMSFLSSQASAWASRRGCVPVHTDPPLVQELAVIRRRDPLGPAAQSLLDSIRAMAHTHLEHPRTDDSRG